MENELLIISSNHKTRIAFTTGFAALGFAITEASDITQAELSIRNDGLPHLIIVDVHGLDRDRLINFASNLRDTAVRFIALGDSNIDFALARKLGADEMLPVPHHLFDMREYVQHIAGYLYRT